MEEIGFGVIERSQPKGDKTKMRRMKIKKLAGNVKTNGRKKQQGLGVFKL
jgi:hypothetical protein